MSEIDIDELVREIRNNSEARLTQSQRDRLGKYAESVATPYWQVCDDSNVKDVDLLGTLKVGPQHPSDEEAFEWAEKQGFRAFSVYHMTPQCSRFGEIFYLPGCTYVWDAAENTSSAPQEGENGS